MPVMDYNPRMSISGRSQPVSHSKKREPDEDAFMTLVRDQQHDTNDAPDSLILVL